MIYKRNEQFGLPQTGVVDGKEISNYHLLPKAILEKEGWKLVEEPVVIPTEPTKSIEERIEEMALQLINAQEALDFLIMGGM